ncbi:MAG: M48 family metalloprotease [Spirulina sp.]
MAEASEPQDPSRRLGDKPVVAKPTVAADLYRQGVAAFKQGLHQEALDHFQQLVQLPTATPQWQLKGRMGLITAQRRLGQIDQAREGCQLVLASGIPEARQWAESMLAELPPLETALPTAPASHPGADPTGFMPLEPSPQPLSTPKSNVPVNQQPQGLPAISLKPPNSVSALENVGDGASSPPTGPSLFHYQNLNQSTHPDPLEDNPPPQEPNFETSGSGVPSNATTTSPSNSAPSQRVQRQLPLPTPYGLWAAQIITTLAVLWVTITGLHGLLRGVNTLLRQVTWPLNLGGIGWLVRDFTVPVTLLFLGLMVSSPWWMDSLLAQFYGQQPLTPRQLQGQHPEFLRQLRQRCQQQGWYLPELRLLPDQAPLCFSYGWRPRHLRIVISQGLLNSGDEEILSTLCAYELAHLINRSTAVISGLGGLLLALHTLYRYLALAGERSSGWLTLPIRGLAQIFYGLFWSLRRGVLWLSRLRSGWADRRVDALLQQPDLQQRSLGWLAHQLPTYLSQQGTLPSLWWSLDVLMPLSPHAALSPGSFAPDLGETATTLNDWANPYRHWLVGGSSHVPLGERLLWLSQRALHRQQSNLNVAEAMTALPPALSIPRLMLQKSPILGLIIGGGIALGFWFIGGLVMRFGWQRLSWWYQDTSLLYGGIFLGLGLGLLVRINALYPDIPSTQTVSDARRLLGAIDQLPVEGEPCRLSGTLIGSLGAPQGQNVYLATLGGVVKLGFSSPQPGLWELRQTSSPLKQWTGRPVIVSGWRRRSDGILWLDVATISLASQRQSVTIAAPMWSTLVSLGLCLGGIFIIWAGI